MEIISLGEDLDHGISPDYTVFFVSEYPKLRPMTVIIGPWGNGEIPTR